MNGKVALVGNFVTLLKETNLVSGCDSSFLNS